MDDLKPYCKEMLTKSKVLFPVPKVDDFVFVGLKPLLFFFQIIGLVLSSHE